MNIRNISIILIAFTLVFSQCSKRIGIYSIENYGAIKNDGNVATKAIQKAINECHANGGGTVIVPPGEFITGSIRLLDNVTLKIEAGAVLKGSSDLNDYLLDSVKRGMIYAENVKNVTITGTGIIDGNGTAFMKLNKQHDGGDYDKSFTRQGAKYMGTEFGVDDGPVAYDARPGMMLVILKSENIRIEDVTFRDSPSWTMRIGDCDHAKVHAINIMNNMLVPNSDGIHCTTSRNVEISDCDIVAGDDAIIVTGFGDEISEHGKNQVPDADYATRKVGNKTGFAENITVTNCVLTSRSSGIRVGYGDNSIRNCVFKNIVIYNSNRGIGVFVRDKGSIENIIFSDFVIETRLHTGHWWGNGEPIHVSAIAQKDSTLIGQIKNIQFNNIIAHSETGIVVWGEKDSRLQNICFNNMLLDIKASRLSDSYGGNFDLRPAKSKERQIFKHDIPGVYCQYVDGLTISDFTLNWSEGLANYYTHGIECYMVDNLAIDRYKGRQALRDSTNSAAIALDSVRTANITNSMALQGTNIFLLHRGLINEGFFTGNNLLNAKAGILPTQQKFTFSGNK